MTRTRSRSHELVIAPGSQGHRYWADAWQARGLLYNLAVRDVSVRYKQAVLGVAWAIVRPLLTMVVFTYIFGRLASLPAMGENAYHVMVFAALLPWQLFSSGVLHGSNSLINNTSLITRVFFPRIVLPASSQAVAILDFAVSFAVLMLLMLIDGHMPTWRVLLLPAFLLLLFIPAFGLALALAALNLRYRDFTYIVPFGLQLGFFLSPIGYAVATLSEDARLWLGLNPMVGIIEGFRWCLLSDPPPLDLRLVLMALVVSLVTLVSGLAYFRRTEATFADRI